MRPSLLATQASFDNRTLEGAGVFTALRSPSTEPPGPRAGPDRRPDREWLLDLAVTLQTTLDAVTLIELFAERVHTLVPIGAIEFVAHTQALRVETAPHAEHRCRYAVVVQERELGTLTFSRSVRPFSGDELGLLEVALANLVHPLRNALLYREAVDAAAKDPLTGLSNRSSLEAILEREVELSRRHGSAFSLAMLDIDRFKQVNDSHGHQAGDHALVTLAQCVREQVRDSDMVFRYGGEEFCVLLSSTALDGALTLGERIRAAVERTVIEADATRMRLTMSIGVAELDAEMDGTALIACADRALYDAKRSGRNQVQPCE